MDDQRTETSICERVRDDNDAVSEHVANITRLVNHYLLFELRLSMTCARGLVDWQEAINSFHLLVGLVFYGWYTVAFEIRLQDCEPSGDFLTFQNALNDSHVHARIYRWRYHNSGIKRGEDLGGDHDEVMRGDMCGDGICARNIELLVVLRISGQVPPF